ncbi:MAG: divalent-cation tolerance protein CutA [Gammaproteobacteria bacterium]|nr:divalent-cation tolerance protein CutA [Gammaproteobacteria bacterium]
MPDSHCIVLCTVPDADQGAALAEGLVADRLAACVNIVPGLTSVYRWQGAVQRDTECLLLIKTRQDRFEALRDVLQARHPYELPEIIAVPVSDGLAAYLAWIDSSIDSSLDTTP